MTLTTIGGIFRGSEKK